MLKATLTIAVGGQQIAVAAFRDGLLRLPPEWAAKPAKDRDRDLAVFLTDAIRQLVRDLNRQATDERAAAERTTTEPALF